MSKSYTPQDKEIDISIEEDKSNQYTLLVKEHSSNEIIDVGSGEAEITFCLCVFKSGEKASDVKVYRVGDGMTWLSTYGGSTVYAQPMPQQPAVMSQT